MTQIFVTFCIYLIVNRKWKWLIAAVDVYWNVKLLQCWYISEMGMMALTLWNQSVHHIGQPVPNCLNFHKRSCLFLNFHLCAGYWNLIRLILNRCTRLEVHEDCFDSIYVYRKKIRNGISLNFNEAINKSRQCLNLEKCALKSSFHFKKVIINSK